MAAMVAFTAVIRVWSCLRHLLEAPAELGMAKALATDTRMAAMALHSRTAEISAVGEEAVAAAAVTDQEAAVGTMAWVDAATVTAAAAAVGVAAMEDADRVETWAAAVDGTAEAAAVVVATVVAADVASMEAAAASTAAAVAAAAAAIVAVAVVVAAVEAAAMAPKHLRKDSHKVKVAGRTGDLR